MDIKDFIKNTVNVAKSIIAQVENYKELNGEEKKARVDEVVCKYVTEVINTIQVNFIIKFALKKILIKNIPTLTQSVFNLIELNIKGITK